MPNLVTGGAGFIGSEVVRSLLRREDSRPVIFDIEPETRRVADLLDRVKTIRGDLGNFSHVLNAAKESRPQIIYHLGGMLSTPSDADPAAALRANALGTFHVLEAARLFGVRQVLFASSIGTYGSDIRDPVIDDKTLQRPEFFYGATKVFGEHMGLFYKRKYGLDFRGIRYLSIVGPGVKTHGVDHYTSWAIERPALGESFTIWVKPETRIPVIYIKDAAGAMLQLAEAPIANIKTVNYVLGGIQPVASAAELVRLVKDRIPSAILDFEPDLELQAILDKILRPIDDSNARREWNWRVTYDQERLVDDFIAEVRRNPGRYYE
jgi:threonine 3-dehydrogenase